MLYGSVFRVSLPITGFLSSWSLDKYVHVYKHLETISIFSFKLFPQLCKPTCSVALHIDIFNKKITGVRLGW